MSLIVAAALAALAASASYLAVRHRPARKSDDESSSDRGAPPPAAETLERSVFEGLPIALGDVVSVESDERWLVGAVVARDRGNVVGVLFLASEGSAQRAVAAFPQPRREIHWLEPTPMETPGEPAATIEIASSTLQRRGRLPVTLERLGQGAPALAETGLWAVYEGGGRDVALIVTSGGRAYAWVGKKYEPGEYDCLGGGGTE